MNVIVKWIITIFFVMVTTISATARVEAWVTNRKGNSISVIDVETMKKIGEDIPVGKSPGGLLAHAGHVWVANWGSHSVSVVDLETMKKVGEDIPVGKGLKIVEDI